MTVKAPDVEIRSPAQMLVVLYFIGKMKSPSEAMLDIAGSCLRNLAQELGLDADDLATARLDVLAKLTEVA